MASLPFVSLWNGRPQVCWFNFYGQEHDTGATMTVSKILTVDNAGQVDRRDVSLKLDIIPAENVETELDEANYFLELDDLITSYNKEKMEQLLTRAEISSLLPAYKAVMEMIK